MGLTDKGAAVVIAILNALIDARRQPIDKWATPTLTLEELDYLEDLLLDKKAAREEGKNPRCENCGDELMCKRCDT